MEFSKLKCFKFEVDRSNFLSFMEYHIIGEYTLVPAHPRAGTSMFQPTKLQKAERATMQGAWPCRGKKFKNLKEESRAPVDLLCFVYKKQRGEGLAGPIQPENLVRN